MKQLAAIFLLCLCINFAYSQEKSTEEKRGVALLASPKKDKVLLRWAPNHHILWKQASTNGYTLERFVLYRDGKQLPQPEYKLLQEGIKANSEPWWENAMQDSLAADYDWLCVAAQAIYGKEFEMIDEKQNPMMQMVYKTREQENRFSFAMFAADQSARVSKAMGLNYTDTDIRENEMYLYRVYPTHLTVEVDTGYVYTGAADYQPLQKPLGLHAKADGKRALIVWNQFLLSTTYNAYMVERSDDGGNSFHSISESPMVLTYGDDGDIPMDMMKPDSLPELLKEYQYRIYGRTAFGETGPYSDVVSAIGRPQYQIGYEDLDQQINDNGEVEIRWKLDSVGKQYVKNMKVLRAGSSTGNFKDVSGELNGKARSFVDMEPLSTNYYKIKATGVNDDNFYSVPLLVQLQDSIPPVAPLNLQGRIDSTGLVHLSWDAGKEKDINGYRVFRSNFMIDEFSQITKVHTRDTFFVDSIDLYNLTPKIYYKVAAIDQRFNQSELSEALLLQKPDTIPPVPPVFSNYEITDEGISLSWVHSFSVDTKYEKLLRKSKESVVCDTIARFSSTDSISSYLDKSPKKGIAYQYCILAEDAGKNQSPAEKWLQAEIADDGFRPELKGVQAVAKINEGHVLLTWKAAENDVVQVNIYRDAEGKELTFYRFIQNKSEFKDVDVELNTHYQYRLQAVYKDGGKSPFTELLQIHY
ncbi:hypothetical protein QUH73_16985 [Labilibaculum sp. K2S]|uniref:fibronectin type III domain-containing protein n=1 Tax=Labilibaculum sp. K2S TaxID=3056386 RepID=UPI0025A3CD80|nr:hypothetical protein [Labilibaculum sp. K2S]MDM8161519.1 hypothetical protein [Labilibaculum sp. K2S]